MMPDIKKSGRNVTIAEYFEDSHIFKLIFWYMWKQLLHLEHNHQLKNKTLHASDDL